jgi:uncharacterized protein involved in tellurium resistance
VSVGRDPAQAPRRADLTFLRHRAKPRAARPEPAPHSTIDMTRPPRRNRATPIAPSADLSLDLSTPPAPPAAASRAAPSTRHRVLPVLDARRAPNGSVTRLGPGSPTVALSRIQSGIGGLEFGLTRAAAAGDLSLGCVYQLDNGFESVVQVLGDVLSGPPGAPLPLLRLKPRPDGVSITFDLRQVPSLRRALLYGYSPLGAAPTWDGIIVTATHGGARIEIPLDHASFDGTMAMVTIYNVEGELVLRSEMEPFSGPPERAAIGFGYAIPWLDGRRPAAA